LFNERLSLVTLHMLSVPIRVSSVENVQLGSILGKERLLAGDDGNGHSLIERPSEEEPPKG
jgi:hypothetical protein